MDKQNRLTTAFDGDIQIRIADSDLFRFLKGMTAAGSPARVHDRMIMAFDQHVGDAPLTDDYTLVVMARD